MQHELLDSCGPDEFFFLFVEKHKRFEIYSSHHQIIIHVNVVNDIVIQEGEFRIGGVNICLQLTDKAYFLGLVEHQDSTAQGFLRGTLFFKTRQLKFS